jgi:hypothetical protein
MSFLSGVSKKTRGKGNVIILATDTKSEVTGEKTLLMCNMKAQTTRDRRESRKSGTLTKRSVKADKLKQKVKEEELLKKTA